MAESVFGKEKASTGIEGLDHVLDGGFPENMTYLVHGGPGVGKTTLGFQFLLEGVRQGQRVLYASLLQTRAELEMVLASHGWSLDGVDLLELPEKIKETSIEEQSFFSTADVELHEVTDAIMQAVDRFEPQRMVFDSITELSILVDNLYQFRRQILKLKGRLSNIGCTTIFTASNTTTIDLDSIQTMVHGVLEMGMHRPYFGEPRRWIDVTKMRGMDFVGGIHDFRLRTGGIEVFPRTEVPHFARRPEWGLISSGIPELDRLFGGGLEEGTATLITGTTGAGKSTLASLYADAAAKRGERSVIYCFDERRQTFLRRSSGLGMDMKGHVEKGLVDLRQVHVGELTPGEFAHNIRHTVDEHGMKVLVIDSLNGYFNAMTEHRQLMIQMHELLSFLSGSGVLTLLIVAAQGFLVEKEIDVDASYIADTVVLMRNFEAGGTICRCISVLKKRYGDHEKTIRELQITQGGIRVGEPLRQFRGLLTGSPEFVGDMGRLLDRGESSEPTDYRF